MVPSQAVRASWLLAVLVAAGGIPAQDQEATSTPEPHYEMKSLRGRVVWLSSALARRYGIKEVPEAAERVLALEDREGNLHPLVEDIRGRAFRRDPRLREMEVELLVRKYAGSPAIQIVRVYEHRPDGRYELDYWCEICSIAMFELKDCECCQAPIELRRRPAPDNRVERPSR